MYNVKGLFSPYGGHMLLTFLKINSFGFHSRSILFIMHMLFTSHWHLFHLIFHFLFRCQKDSPIIRFHLEQQSWRQISVNPVAAVVYESRMFLVLLNRSAVNHHSFTVGMSVRIFNGLQTQAVSDALSIFKFREGFHMSTNIYVRDFSFSVNM